MSLPAEATEPSHAGGVVHRLRAGVREFLLVTARRTPQHWVLPKGHIDPGESPEQAAVREVLEESGVHARVQRWMEDVVVEMPHERQRIRYFLMQFEKDGVPLEVRGVEWLPAVSAKARLSFAETRALVQAAAVTLSPEAPEAPGAPGDHEASGPR